ncbi:hypothetical protein MMC07_007686 [Pseudocyphellaria aurata]|nr:hypothetical protein [Pseudocyphellaria aurata]
MLIPEMRFELERQQQPFQVAIVGIEAHICVTQTALDLLAEGHKVYVLADGVSSCHEGEVGVALRRLAREGVIVTTSEGWLYECMGDAAIPEYVFPVSPSSSALAGGCWCFTGVQGHIRAGQGDEAKHKRSGANAVQDVNSIGTWWSTYQAQGTNSWLQHYIRSSTGFEVIPVAPWAL